MTTGVWLAVGIGVGIVVVVGALVALSPLLRARPAGRRRGLLGRYDADVGRSHAEGFRICTPLVAALGTPITSTTGSPGDAAHRRRRPLRGAAKDRLALAEAGFTVAEP